MKTIIVILGLPLNLGITLDYFTVKYTEKRWHKFWVYHELVMTLNPAQEAQLKSCHSFQGEGEKI